MQGDERLTELSLEFLVPRLIAEFGYPAEGARIVAEKIAACGPQVRAAFAMWWQTGELTDLEIEGYTVERLMAEHNMKPIAAFLTLDWLGREPEKARASLRRGHDRIG